MTTIDSDATKKYLEQVIASSNTFSKDLYLSIANEVENIFCSPISVYTALILPYIGAAGKTAEEFNKCLHIPDSKDELLLGVRALLDLLKNPKLNMASEIFIEKSYLVKPEYVQRVQKFLNAASQSLDFCNAYAEAEKLINEWVSTQTRERIKDVIPPGTLNTDTRIVIVNAIHFKDEWLHKFENYNTRDGDFHVSIGKTISVPMMNQTTRFKYLEKDTFKLVQLPYQDQNFSMIIFLPNDIDGLKLLEEKLPSLDVSKLLDEAAYHKVALKLPKFKMEKSIDLKEVLQKLGLGHMFTNAANFSDIFVPTEEPIRVDKVLHKAFIEVNEDGTEAAAATAVVMEEYLCHHVDMEPIVNFYIDRPFYFLLLFQKVILFSGTVSKPVAS